MKMRRKIPIYSFLLVSSCILLFPFSSLAQAPDWDSVHADYFIKYQPVDTPAWIFPICFKDYNGDWDTVYIGYDNNASFQTDTQFAEGIVKFDTSVFNATLGIQADSGYAVNITNIFSDNFSIEFTKGTMPLTMYWNGSLFYSDSLPFPDLAPLPRTRGELWCGDGNPMFINCPTGFPITLTDNPDSIPPIAPPAWASDSIFFNGDTAGPFSNVQYMVGSLVLNIVRYNKSWLGIQIKNKPDIYFNCYPNPVSNKLLIENRTQVSFQYSLFDYTGRQLMSDNETSQLVSVDFSKLPNGIYFIKIDLDDKRSFITEKIIKAN